MKKAINIITHIIPRKHHSSYQVNSGYKVSVWKQWLGICYDIRTWNVEVDG